MFRVYAWIAASKQWRPVTHSIETARIARGVYDHLKKKQPGLCLAIEHPSFPTVMCSRCGKPMPNRTYINNRFLFRREPECECSTRQCAVTLCSSRPGPINLEFYDTFSR
jgi:hypothetical protein